MTGTGRKRGMMVWDGWEDDGVVKSREAKDRSMADMLLRFRGTALVDYIIICYCRRKGTFDLVNNNNNKRDSGKS